MATKTVKRLLLTLLVAVGVYLLMQTSFASRIQELLNAKVVSEDYYVLFLVAVSIGFFLIFIYLRWGLRSWYETTGQIINRVNALKSKTSYPVVEYIDKHGLSQHGEANRAAFWYPSSAVRIRVSPKGTIHVKGVEWGALFMSMFILGAATVMLFV